MKIIYGVLRLMDEMEGVDHSVRHVLGGYACDEIILEYGCGLKA